MIKISCQDNIKEVQRHSERFNFFWTIADCYIDSNNAISDEFGYLALRLFAFVLILDDGGGMRMHSIASTAHDHDGVDT